MDMKSEIRKLARMEDGISPFCSLYLNTKWDDEQQRERMRLFTKNRLKNALEELKDREDWKKVFAADQQQIERYVDGLVRRVYDEKVRGIAIFSCSGKGTFLTYPSFIPFENEFFLRDYPALQPLVRLSSQYQNTLTVMVDTDSAKLFEVSLEGVLGEFSIESYVPGRHDQGGPAQMRYQRHIKDHMDRHHKEVAEHLTELFDSGQWKRVVLIGQDRIVSNFRVFLPERVRQHVVDTFSIDFSEERSKVVLRALERLLDKESKEVRHDIKSLAEKALKGGMATFGINGTLEALNRGQIHTLYLLTKLPQSGGKCLRCGVLAVGPSHPCPVCKGEIRTIDLGEEMVRLALRQDGEVKLVEDDAILKENEGMAASLRFQA
jgi:peptide subunit release factor 1 (eRF1)